MIVRILLAGFVSLVSGFCYAAGLLRLMSALLIGFGVCTALFFGIVFLLPPGDDRITFGVSGSGASWPFFLLAGVLVLLIIRLFIKKNVPAGEEPFTPRHFRLLFGGLFLYLASLFTPVLLWFPSEEELHSFSTDTLELMVLGGVALNLVGLSIALSLLYRASRGMTGERPDLMRRFVLVLFSVAHLDKMPALVAYLLVYSAEPELVFPASAALALAAYLPVAWFLSRISLEARSES